MEVKLKKGATENRDPVEAIKEMVAQIGFQKPSVTALFVSSLYDLESLSQQIRMQFRGPVICCTTAGEITSDGYKSYSITGFSLSGDCIAVTTFPVTDIRNPDPKSMQLVIEMVRKQIQSDRQQFPERDSFGVLLIDGLSVREEHIAAMFGNALSDIPIIGGSAGDDLKFEKCSILINETFVTDAALFCLFSTSLPFSIVKSQHFCATDKRLVITRAKPNERIVEEINGVLAVDEYSRIIGIPKEQIGPETFSRYPLILRHSKDIHVRSIQKINPDGSLTFYCAIDDGVVLRVAERLNMCDALEQSLSQAEKTVDKVLFTLGFDCTLRRLESREFNYDDRMRGLFKQYNVIGFCTYGEQSNSLHVNQTFSGVVVGEVPDEYRQ